jgi:outer membrane protein OmpA-like peptidoglycan-associated protein
MVKKDNFFWIGYSDLMTSLFFIMLVLFVVTIGYLQHQKNATEKQLKKIQELQTSVQQLPSGYFEYQPQYKRFKLKKQIQFAVGKSEINPVYNQYLYSVGKSIAQLIENLKNEEKFKGLDIKYLVVVEGMASRTKDNFKYNFELSYERALALYRLWQHQKITFNPNVCEIQIAGSGTQGIREFSGVEESKNQQFLIHIIPKIGKIEVNPEENNNMLQPQGHTTSIALKRRTTRFGIVSVFQKADLRLEITSKRPDKKNENILLCIPAAFSMPRSGIDGLFIEKGELISSKPNGMNGGFIIDSGNNIFIENISQANLTYLGASYLKNKSSIFQQALLIDDGNVIPCSLWSNSPIKKYQRRALAFIDSQLYLIESNDLLTIQDFQSCLVELGVQKAICTDMASYSYGWYRYEGKIIDIGKEAVGNGTQKQSNWLIFKR